MSLRARLLLTLGVTLAVTWALAVTWSLRDLNTELERTLDQRLAQSARMVAGLMARVPATAWAEVDDRLFSVPPLEGIACQVASARGMVLARTHDEMSGVLDIARPGYAYRQQGTMTWRVYTYVRDGLVITTADRLDVRNRILSEVLWVAVVPFLVALVGSLAAL
ncbi:hypothetical protein ACSEE7_20115 [Halomonas cupida]|uniref:hypothetical protein n=1 Tax=Halomonas cupida TaxID=44933 RepID=UPI003EFA684A